MSRNSKIQGWLYKRCSIFRTWTRRFVILDGQTLRYFKTEKSNAKERGSIKIGSLCNNTDRENSFTISDCSGRSYKFYAENISDYLNWYGLLQQRVNQMDAKQSILLESTASRITSATSTEIGYRVEKETPIIITCGWLMKANFKKNTWKNFYFCLRGRYLSHFSTSKMGGAGNGYGYVHCVTVSEKHLLTLNIFLYKGTEKILTVTAASRDELDIWFNAIFHAICIEQSILENSDVIDDIEDVEMEHFEPNALDFLNNTNNQCQVSCA